MNETNSIQIYVPLSVNCVHLRLRIGFDVHFDEHSPCNGSPNSVVVCTVLLFFIDGRTIVEERSVPITAE